MISSDRRATRRSNSAGTASWVMALRSGVWKVTPQTSLRRFRLKAGEIFAETGDQVGLGEHHIDREVDLQLLVQLGQTGADGFGMGLPAWGVSFIMSSTEKDRMTPLIGRFGRVLFQQVKEGVPAGLVGGRSLSCVV
jgi:hypothetical protein